VKIYPDSPSIPMHIKFFKYLSRVYVCNLDKISTDDLSDEIQQSLLDSPAANSKILLVQMIDNSNKYGAGQKFSSEYPI
jgi:hypothetical protein